MGAMPLGYRLNAPCETCGRVVPLVIEAHLPYWFAPVGRRASPARWVMGYDWLCPECIIARIHEWEAAQGIRLDSPPSPG